MPLGFPAVAPGAGELCELVTPDMPLYTFISLSLYISMFYTAFAAGWATNASNRL